MAGTPIGYQQPSEVPSIRLLLTLHWHRRRISLFALGEAAARDSSLLLSRREACSLARVDVAAVTSILQSCRASPPAAAIAPRPKDRQAAPGVLAARTKRASQGARTEAGDTEANNSVALRLVELCLISSARWISVRGCEALYCRLTAMYQVEVTPLDRALF